MDQKRYSQLTSTDIARALKNRIFDPLGMKDTYMRYSGPSDEVNEKRLADVWAWNGPMMSGQVNLSFTWNEGVASTLDDLHIFVKALASGKLYRNPATLSEMLKVPENIRSLSYASGMAVFPADGGTILHLAGSNGTWVDYHMAQDFTVIGTVDDYHGVMHQIDFRGEVYKILNKSGLIAVPIRPVPSVSIRIVSGLAALVMIVVMVAWLIDGIRAHLHNRLKALLVRLARKLTMAAALVHIILVVAGVYLVFQNPVQVMFGFTHQVRLLMYSAWYLQLAATVFILAMTVFLWRKKGPWADRILLGLVTLAGVAYGWAMGAILV